MRSLAVPLLPLLLAPLLLAAPMPALAQTSGSGGGLAVAPVIMPPPVMDEVVLHLSAEDWVTTETARVEVAIEATATQTGGGSGSGMRDELLAAATSLAPEAQWRIVTFDRFSDPSGLERSRAVVETRLPEEGLGGLAEKARQASRPGLQVRIGQIEFTPLLAEIEAVRKRLRAEIYARVGEEVQALQSAFPSRSYRVGSIRFIEAREPMPMPMMARAEAAPMADAKMMAPAGVSEKLQVSADVVLSAVAPQR
jgi:hypothetical protein